METPSLKGLERQINLPFSLVLMIVSDLLSLQQQVPGAQTSTGSKTDHSDPPQLCFSVAGVWIGIGFQFRQDVV